MKKYFNLKTIHNLVFDCLRVLIGLKVSVLALSIMLVEYFVIDGKALGSERMDKIYLPLMVYYLSLLILFSVLDYILKTIIKKQEKDNNAN